MSPFVPILSPKNPDFRQSGDCPFFPMHREKHLILVKSFVPGKFSDNSVSSDASRKTRFVPISRIFLYIFSFSLFFLSIYRYIEWGQKEDKNHCFSRCIEKNTLSVLSPAKGQKQPFFPTHREKQDGDKNLIRSNLRGQMGTNHCFSRCIGKIAGTKYIACYGFLTVSIGLVEVNL